MNIKYVAQIVIFNDMKEVLGVSRKDNHLDMGLPGGKMEDIDHDIIDCAIRETFEETGIIVKREDLTLVYVIHKHGYMSYTYLASIYEGYINHSEPHIAKWVDFSEIIKGSFGEYNKAVYESIKDMNIGLL